MRKFFEVSVYDDNVAEFSPQETFVVQSNEPRHAITNVLTNKYKGVVTKVEVKEVQPTFK